MLAHTSDKTAAVSAAVCLAIIDIIA
jgi:hypothetical protein